MHIRFLPTLLICGALAASGQTAPSKVETRSVSLPECIDLALSRNLDLQIARMYPGIANYQLRSTYGAYDPTLSFEARRDSVSTPSDFDPKKTGLDLPYELSYSTVGPEVKGRLPMGLSYDLSAVAGQQRAITDLNSDPATAIKYPGGIRQTNNFTAETAVSLRQHLLRDFWTDEYRETIQIRRKDLKISEQGLRFQIMKTVLAVELTYYDLLAAREKVRVEENALELRRQFVKETKRRVEVGDLPPLDDEQARTQLENTQTALTAAREAFTGLQNALIGLVADDFKQWADTDLEPSGALVALEEELNRSESFGKAMSNRPDLLQARLEVEKNDVIVKFHFNQLFPSLDIVGSYGGLGIQPDLESAISDAAHARNPVYYYGAVMSFPLGNITERNNYKAGKSTRELAQLQLKKAEQGVLLQVADSVNRVQSRFNQVGSTRLARTYAESALAAEEKKLENGLTTAFVVLELQQILITARNAEAQALADYNKAVAQLAFAEGTTLERRHLALKVR